MKLDWMMLCNYAEAPPNSGLIYVMGGGWDTITAGAPLQGLPPGTEAVAVVHGTLALRLLAHATESGRDHKLEVTIVDEDGGEIAKIEGDFRVERDPGLPPAWNQGVNLVFPLTGLPLPRFGLYNVSLLVDGQHLDDRPFRVLKGY